MTDDQIAKLAEADDALKRLTIAWEGLAATLLVPVIPRLLQVLDLLTRIGNAKASSGGILSTLGNLPGIPKMLAAGAKLAGVALDTASPPSATSSGAGAGPPRERTRTYVAPPSGPGKDKKAGKDWHEAIAGEINAAYREAMTTAVEVNDDLMRPLGQMIEDAGNQAEKALEANAKAIEKEFGGTLKGMSVFAEEAARNMQDAFAEFLFDPFKDGLGGMLRGFADILRRMAAEAAAAKVFEWLGGKAGSGGILGAIGGFFSGAATKKALGGPVTGGRPYVVGETGPELFVPTSSGTIQPRLAGVNGITVHNTFHISAPDGRVSRATQQQVAAAAARGTSLASRRNN